MKLFTGTESLGLTEEQLGVKLGTLGIPEMGTFTSMNMIAEAKPKNFADLLQISGLSHGTDVWSGNAQDLIRSGIADLSSVIGCRDDIMVYLIHKGLENGLAFTIMERVRNYHSGQSVTQLSKEYDVAPATIYKWIDLYSKSNESSVSKADFLELKRQLAKVKEERDILKKVLTIFAEKKK